MKTTLIIIWLLLGLISIWRAYWGDIKDWYEKFEEDVRNTHYTARYVLLWGSPILIAGGLLSFILLEIDRKSCWYFKIPKK